MPRLLKYLIVAVLGGVIAAGGVMYFTPRAAGVPLVGDAAPPPGGRPWLVAGTSPAPLSSTVDLRAAARLATPVVVQITARSPGRRREAVKQLFGPRDPSRTPEGTGSGVIYTSDGYIVTNYHVVEDAAEITVTTHDNRRFAAGLVGAEPKADLAVLKVEATGLDFLKIANSDAAEPGEWVLAVGNPLGLSSTVTAGIISARGRNLGLLPGLDAIESFLQTDAAVNPGNSGGPLVNARGELLGVNTAIVTRSGRYSGYSFAIPSNLVRRITEDIILYGSYRRVYLGVEISTLTQADIRRIQPGRTEGVVIDAIFAGGPAAAAGLRVDDVITAVNDRPVRTLPDLTEIIGRARSGETLNFTVVRNGEALRLVVEMK